MLKSQLQAIVGGFRLYAEFFEIVYRDLLKEAEKVDWPFGPLNASSKGGANAAAHLQHIADYAADQSGQLAHIPAIARLNRVAIMVLEGLAESIEGDLFEALEKLEAKSSRKSNGSQNATDLPNGHEGSSK